MVSSSWGSTLGSEHRHTKGKRIHRLEETWCDRSSRCNGGDKTRGRMTGVMTEMFNRIKTTNSLATFRDTMFPPKNNL